MAPVVVDAEVALVAVLVEAWAVLAGAPLAARLATTRLAVVVTRAMGFAAVVAVAGLVGASAPAVMVAALVAAMLAAGGLAVLSAVVMAAAQMAGSKRRPDLHTSSAGLRCSGRSQRSHPGGMRLSSSHAPCR